MISSKSKLGLLIYRSKSPSCRRIGSGKMRRRLKGKSLRLKLLVIDLLRRNKFMCQSEEIRLMKRLLSILITLIWIFLCRKWGKAVICLDQGKYSLRL
jgi:hypothetical protein